MLIQLRPKSETGPGGPKRHGFEGAQSARLQPERPRRLQRRRQDRDPAGLGADQARPSRERSRSRPRSIPQAAKESGATKGQASRRAGAARPPLRRADAGRPAQAAPAGQGGPAGPAGPTLVHFTRNVVVRRGKLAELPDQLDCDNLDLTLVPAEKPAPEARQGARTGSQAATVADRRREPGQDPAAEDAASSGSEEQKGMFGDLTLRRVKATRPRRLAPACPPRERRSSATS